MKIVLFGVLAMAAIMGIVTLVGYRLPVRHRASGVKIFQTPAAQIWAVISDYRSYPTWRPEVKSVAALDTTGKRSGWIEHGTNGDIPYEVVESVPDQRLTLRIASNTLPFGGQWVIEIAPVTAGTRVSITEEGEVYNPIFRFVSRFLIGHTRTIQNYLDALEARLQRPGKIARVTEI